MNTSTTLLVFTFLMMLWLPSVLVFTAWSSNQLSPSHREHRRRVKL